MFYSVTGPLLHTEPNVAVIDCGGVGFKCFISMNTQRRLPTCGTKVTLFTYLHVKEDALDLFGFLDMSELTCFKLLLSVSGVGAKTALAVLSEYTAERVALCIATGDSKALTKVSGIGAKGAQRIVLELRDKFKGLAIDTDTGEVLSGGIPSAAGNAAEAAMALSLLGYGQSEAAAAVAGLDSSLAVEILIREGLKKLSAERR